MFFYLDGKGRQYRCHVNCVSTLARNPQVTSTEGLKSSRLQVDVPHEASQSSSQPPLPLPSMIPPNDFIVCVLCEVLIPARKTKVLFLLLQCLTGPNHGRIFYSCCTCNFFRWKIQTTTSYGNVHWVKYAIQWSVFFIIVLANRDVI